VPLHTHLAETALEEENSRNEHGMPVIPYVKKQNLFRRQGAGCPLRACGRWRDLYPEAP